MTLGDAARDLLLGGSCLGCGTPGRLVCPACDAGLPATAETRWPSPVPPALVAPWSTGPYDGLLRALVVGHKDHRLLALTPVLGRLLAVAVSAALLDAGVRLGPGLGSEVLLVPVPSRPATTRARGHDPMLAATRAAAVRLGTGADVVPLLRSRPGTVDQSGLDVTGRRANLHHSMAVRPRPLRALARRGRRVHVVVCDDVLTTGSTLREAQRALAAVGLDPLAAAVVAATARLHPLPGPPARRQDRLHGETSGPEVPPPPATH